MLCNVCDEFGCFVWMLNCVRVGGSSRLCYDICFGGCMLRCVCYVLFRVLVCGVLLDVLYVTCGV